MDCNKYSSALVYLTVFNFKDQRSLLQNKWGGVAVGGGVDKGRITLDFFPSNGWTSSFQKEKRFGYLIKSYTLCCVWKYSLLKSNRLLID